MNARLNYRIMGEGEPLLILHGLLGSHRNWLGFSRPLAQRYRVILVDLRNHGESEHCGSMGYAEMAGDITALLDQLGIKRATLIGHSMGGKVAMTCALLHPDRLRELIILDIAPVDYGSRFDALFDAMLALPLEQISTRQEADEHLARSVPETMLRQSVLQNLVRDAAGWRWRINIAAIKAALAGIGGFPGFSAGHNYPERTLFIRAENSAYILPEHRSVITQLFPAATITDLAGAGHWLHLDQPQPLRDTITHHLR